MEQENVDNGRPAKKRHASCTSCKGLPSSTAAGTLKSQRKRGDSDQVDGLAHSLANVKLSGDLKEKDDLREKTVANRDDRPISSNYKPLPFPPKGYTTDTIQVSSTKSARPSNLLLSSLDVIKKSGENKTVNKLYASTSLVATVAAMSHSVKVDPESPPLEENIPKLIDMAKRCLKSTNSIDGNKKKSSDPTLNIALLRVAIYSLRSVLPIMAKSKSHRSNVSVVIKLLYHCSVLAGDACYARFKLWGTAKSKMKQEDIGLILEHALLCLGAYEGLGMSLHIGGKTNAPTNCCGAVCWDELVPINVAPSKDLSQQQASKIVLESSFCAASCLICLSLTSMYVKASKISDKLTVPNDFHFTDHLLSETILCEMPKAIPSFQLIINNVIMPHVLRSLEGDSNVFNGDGLRHVKKGFRLLWECSRTIETICALMGGSALRMACLDMQLSAIYFVLKILAKVKPQLLRGSSPSDLIEIVDLFDRSASSAMKSCGLYEKAAGLFDESPSASLTRKKEALCHFHCVIGSEMETAATLIFERGEMPPSAYFEYSVYRIIHRWRLKGDLASTRPFKIPGDRTGSSDSLIGQSIQSVIHLSVQTLHGLSSGTQAREEAECDGIASRFHKYVINEASASSLARCRSMLLMLELKSQATKLPQVQDGRFNRNISHQFAVLGFILGRILAPLEHKLARVTNEPQKASTLSLSSADSSAKAATLMEAALDNTSEDLGDLRLKYAKEADHFLRESFDLLLSELGKLKKQEINGKARPVLAIEMFAKGAAMANKQRVRRKVSCVRRHSVFLQ